ncbi:phosphoserine phosphatase SerB [Flaviflagellibacter deserti]|uniref:Phosphoserine phosphatase n=1 Tax=Flaviflagellibacter deserti TaxID=2267266 RepID=A0ABV9Z8J3_9HYPH
MLHIAVLTANPDNPVVNGDLLDRVRAALPGAHDPKSLADGVAAEIAFEADAGSLPGLLDDVGSVLGNSPVDLNILPPAHRRKALLVADMDSTMIGQECVDELADLVGLKAQVSLITERAMQGEIAFEPALRERVALLKGLATNQIDRLLEERITLMSGAETLVKTMRANGAHTALVSGGFTLFTGPVAARLGFHEDRSNRLDLDGEFLRGTIAEPILGREAKREALVELRDALGLNREQTLAVGDGANDLAMIAEAGLGVAFRAKPAVAAAAGARVTHGDLTALLYLQGYHRDEFAA